MQRRLIVVLFAVTTFSFAVIYNHYIYSYYASLAQQRDTLRNVEEKKITNHENDQINSNIIEIKDITNPGIVEDDDWLKHVSSGGFYNDSRYISEFDKFIFDYKKRYKTFQSYVKITCLKPVCGGVADRWKQIVIGATLALLTDRAIIIEMVHGYRLEDFYEPNLIEWRMDHMSHLVKKEPPEFIKCMDSSCTCLFDRFGEARKPSEVDILSGKGSFDIKMNTDCVAFMTRLGYFEDKAIKYGMINENIWRAKLFKVLFKPSKFLEAKVREVMQVGIQQLQEKNKNYEIPLYPSYGIHVRIGGPALNDWPRVEEKDIADMLNNYVKCYKKMRKSYDSTPQKQKVIVALLTDDQRVIDKITKDLGREHIILTTAKVGQLGHVESQRTENSDLRMFVDFELMRRSKTMLIAPSGFSVVAYNFREIPSAIAVSGFERPDDFCKWIYRSFGNVGNA